MNNNISQGFIHKSGSPQKNESSEAISNKAQQFSHAGKGQQTAVNTHAMLQHLIAKYPQLESFLTGAAQNIANADMSETTDKSMKKQERREAKLEKFQQWEQNVWNPSGPHAETKDFVSTKWGFEGSSTQLNAFKAFLRESKGKDPVTSVNSNEGEKKPGSKKLDAFQQWEQNVWVPTGPHMESRDFISTKWGYEGSSTKLKAFNQFFKANNGNMPDKPVNIQTQIDAQGVDSTAGVQQVLELTNSETLELYNNWLSEVWFPTGPHMETRDLRSTEWGYTGSGTRLGAFHHYAAQQGYKI